MVNSGTKSAELWRRKKLLLHTCL